MCLDPANAELLMLLLGLEPETELVARLAISQLSSRCRLDAAWAERTEALRVKIVGNDEDKLARIVRAAQQMAEEMTARQEQRKVPVARYPAGSSP